MSFLFALSLFWKALALTLQSRLARFRKSWPLFGACAVVASVGPKLVESGYGLTLCGPFLHIGSCVFALVLDNSFLACQGLL